MENMVVKSSFWKGKKVLITGHTGFKGSWLSLWLYKMGSVVYGLSLTSEKNKLYDELKLNKVFKKTTLGDIKNINTIKNVLQISEPQIIIHMAAQALVSDSFLDPIKTFNTNIMGTANLLECARYSKSVKVILNVTSDKCYENFQLKKMSFKEDDAMGGYDPYSASKGCSELITTAFRNSFYGKTDISIATARAGNVIGGGDWSKNRIVPDVIRSLRSGKILNLRNPESTRPWQHVLEPLSGYLILCQHLFLYKKKFSESWNFGPSSKDSISVLELINIISKYWDDKLKYKIEKNTKFYESPNLKLNCSKSKSKLSWKPVWSVDKCLNKTVSWYKSWYDKEDMRKFTLDQIESYENDSKF